MNDEQMSVCIMQLVHSMHCLLAKILLSRQTHFVTINFLFSSKQGTYTKISFFADYYRILAKRFCILWCAVILNAHKMHIQMNSFLPIILVAFNSQFHILCILYVTFWYNILIF